MKWPTTNKASDKPDLSSLSDDKLDDLMVAAGLMDQNEFDQQCNSRLMIALANLPGGPPEYFETLRGLVKLRDEGPFPFEAQDMYDRLRARALSDVKAARKAATHRPTPPPADVAPDTSMAGWLKARWSSADEAVRHTLQAVASTVGAAIPMSRTRKSSVAGQDSSGSQRSESQQHPNRTGEHSTEMPAEAEEPCYHDPPQWHDELADGWEPCTSLHDALHSEDRGWY